MPTEVGDTENWRIAAGMDPEPGGAVSEVPGSAAIRRLLGLRAIRQVIRQAIRQAK